MRMAHMNYYLYICIHEPHLLSIYYICITNAYTSGLVIHTCMRAYMFGSTNTCRYVCRPSVESDLFFRETPSAFDVVKIDSLSLQYPGYMFRKR
jgi:hypothetical protein